MRRCLELARSALERGEVPVGAVIVDGERVVGEGAESTRALVDPSAHAEVRAVQAACQATGSTALGPVTLYSTVEPCVLCAYALRAAGVAVVVYGIEAGRLGGCSSRYALLTDASIAGWAPPPRIVPGVLASECAAIMDDYARRRASR